MAAEPVRIAMWSGPRNISTALMRSWEARGDTWVCDEPFYAHYLAATGLEHPGAAEVVESCETDPASVIATLLGPVPGGRAIFYQKHMAHHLLPDVDRGWLDGVASCFLVRDPAEMALSLAKVIAEPRLEETGLPQQVELFEREMRRLGAPPPVVDARDVLEDPRVVLGALCGRLGVPFTDRMLRWEPGRRATDGVWARHWYDAVERTSGFAPYRPKREPVPERLEPLVAACEPIYRAMWTHRITSKRGAGSASAV